MLPEQFDDLLTAVYAFTDALIDPTSTRRTWDRDARRWTDE
jgi:hypothetical protein